MSGNINDTDTVLLLKEVDLMRNDISKNGKKHIDYYICKYKYLAEFPSTMFPIYDGLLNKRDDLNRFRAMLGSVSKIQNKHVSLEDETVRMGEILAEKYIYDTVGDRGKPVTLEEGKEFIRKGKMKKPEYKKL